MKVIKIPTKHKSQRILSKSWTGNNTFCSQIHRLLACSFLERCVCTHGTLPSAILTEILCCAWTRRPALVRHGRHKRSLTTVNGQRLIEGNGKRRQRTWKISGHIRESILPFSLVFPHGTFLLSYVFLHGHGRAQPCRVQLTRGEKKKNAGE